MREFTEGLNTLVLPRNHQCNRGYLSFCLAKKSWMFMADMYEADLADLVWIATVTQCDDSRVEHLEHRSKTDKFVLG